MILKQEITLDCLFLHDTPMAELEKEQKLFNQGYLRQIHEHTRGTELPGIPVPFSILPPFCASGYEENQVSLLIEAPQNHEGWLIRPIRGTELTEKPGTELKKHESAITPPPIQFPGYRALPPKSGFILGFAGIHADSLVTELKGCVPFRVNVWYRAAMAVTIEYDEGRCYSAHYTIGKAVWHRKQAKPLSH